MTDIEWTEAEEELAVEYLRALQQRQQAQRAVTDSMVKLTALDQEVEHLGVVRNGRGRKLRNEVYRRLEMGNKYLSDLTVFRWEKGGPFDIDAYLKREDAE